VAVGELSEVEQRTAPQATQIGEELAKATARQAPQLLDTLAAAYAEAGRFEEAIRVAQEAAARAETNHQAELAAMIQSRLALYENTSPTGSRHLDDVRTGTT
jgi:protein O-mannosyl-transferase